MTATPDYYDLHEDMIPELIRNSRWSCLDCPEPAPPDSPWETVTDYCPGAHKHHLATGHRVNGQVEVRYRAAKLPFPGAAAPGTKENPDA